MRESFSEYRKTLESNIIKFSYLYSGDVLSCSDITFSELIPNNSGVSPKFIINTITDIYEKSIKRMIDKSESFIINKSDLNLPILKKIEKYNIKTRYVFCGKNALNEYFHNTYYSFVFPDYFYKKQSIGHVNIFYSPLIFEEENTSVIYVTDAGIQSLVYTVQNMIYDIKKDNIFINDSYYWKHTMNYQLFECDYKSYKIIIKDVSKIRDDRIFEILNNKNE